MNLKVGNCLCQNHFTTNVIALPILWILSSGAAWRDLPTHFGNWNSIYHKFRLWCSLGTVGKLKMNTDRG